MADYPKRRYHYQYGSEAPNYLDSPYRLPETKPDSTPLKRPKPQKRSKEDIIFGCKMSVCGLVLFVGAFCFVSVTSDLAIKQRELKLINTELRETQSAINSVQATIAANLNLEHIQQVAKEQLNMSEPLPHQVVYLSLDQESYTVYDE
ncbi:hypothetical protein PBV87_13315 [Niameybacter massiliensis]|uniref:Cell division protein FtsL n=1 Tax=Holtiella tumoricola TaxID=3018743 RepID=A0AA42J1S4_9FIRM|nr:MULTISPECIES: hypothetical protein [Lachnospirales]MDA3732466.1 hypothetical protein [Holtiella tumoricola]